MDQLIMAMVPKALVSVPISPKTRGDAERLSQGLRRISTEEPPVESRLGHNPGEVILGSISEEYLEIVLDRLHREFGVEASLGRPAVEYRAALIEPVEGETQATTQITGRGDFAYGKVRILPGETSTGLVIQSHGSSLATHHLRAVQQGVRDRLSDGLLNGYPTDLRVDLYDWYDGADDSTDSNDAAFRRAGSLAIEDALRRAQVILLEPLMRLDVVVPPEYAHDVRRSLATRGGVVEFEGENGEVRVIRARVLLAALFGFRVDLRSSTLGHGKYSMQLERYVPVRRAGDDDRNSFVRVPLRPAPSLRTSAVALPAPPEDTR